MSKNPLKKSSVAFGLTRIFLWGTRISHCIFWTRISRITRIFLLAYGSQARMLVRVGMLIWSLLNENDTNEINTDSTRGFVNTHCLRLVLKNRIFIFFFSNYRKASFHCTYLSKKIQIFTAVYNSMFKIQQRRDFFLI